LFKTQEGVVIGFQIFAWAPKKNNKKSGKKIKNSDPHPLAPWRAIFSFFLVFLENIRRKSVIVPKLHRWFILTKKGDLALAP
jgi:hypothetical protein